MTAPSAVSRVRMALAEAGYPDVDVWEEDGEPLSSRNRHSRFGVVACLCRRRTGVDPVLEVLSDAWLLGRNLHPSCPPV